MCDENGEWLNVFYLQIILIFRPDKGYKYLSNLAYFIKTGMALSLIIINQLVKQILR